jgi:hypothetical protein
MAGSLAKLCENVFPAFCEARLRCALAADRSLLFRFALFDLAIAIRRSVKLITAWRNKKMFFCLAAIALMAMCY